MTDLQDGMIGVALGGPWGPGASGEGALTVKVVVGFNKQAKS